MNKKFIINDDDTIVKYFKDIRKTKILTQEEEVSLAKKIKLGDTNAINTLVNSNLKFVVSIAKEYQGQGLSLSDLINEGNLGLIKAATRFDHTKGFRFISYAVWWVKQSILQSISDNGRTVRLPINAINKLSRLNKEIAKFEKNNEREPVYGDLIGDNDEYMSIITYPKCSSLNDQINNDGDELIDLLQSDENDDGVLETNRLKSELSETLSILDDRERNIIECYFGINTNCKPMTLEAIGEEYGLTKERIRQIKEKAIRKLRYNASNLHKLLTE